LVIIKGNIIKIACKSEG